MSPTFLVLLSLVLAVAWFAQRRDSGSVSSAIGFTKQEGARLVLTVPLALIAAQCIGELLPSDVVGSILGVDAGLLGIVLAALIGGLLPGGPVMTFPLVLVLVKEGVGMAQFVALLTGWSVYAVNRVLVFEAPTMGWRFVGLRLASAWFIPPLAGLLAGMLAAALGVKVVLR